MAAPAPAPAAAAEAVDNEEYTLGVVPECFVFKIPPASSAAGHKAADWHNQVWTGALHIMSKGDDALLKLISADGSLFAMAPQRYGGPQALERVIDSSRFFVLRVEDAKGRHAFIGLGFNDRSDAFNLNVALQDHFKEVQVRREGGGEAKRDEPSLDLSLKDGQTIRVSNVAKKKAGDAPAPAPASAGAASSSWVTF